MFSFILRYLPLHPSMTVESDKTFAIFNFIATVNIQIFSDIFFFFLVLGNSKHYLLKITQKTEKNTLGTKSFHEKSSIPVSSLRLKIKKYFYNVPSFGLSFILFQSKTIKK